MTQCIRFRRGPEYINFESHTVSFAGNAFLPSRARIPLVTAGVPSLPLVQSGDKVREGQLVARGTTPGSTHIHAPVPGTVREIKSMPLPDGTNGNTMLIELSGSFNILGRKEENHQWKNASESELLRVIEDKGVLNTFDIPKPLGDEIRKVRTTGTTALVVRLFDLDPTCGTDAILVRDYFDEILTGAGIVARAIGTKKVFLVYSETAPIHESPFLGECFPGCSLKTVKAKNRYPSGNSARIRKLLTASSNEVNNDNTIFIEPVTAMTVFDAVIKNHPVISRYLYLTGTALHAPSFLKVKIGTPIGDVIEECGGFRTDPSRIIVNGLLTGTAIFNLDTPISKTCKSIHVMDKDSCPPKYVHDCIHCGKCLAVCPVYLDPIHTVSSIRYETITPVASVALQKCEQCGCCAIVCPSRIPLNHIIGEASRRYLNGEKK